MYLLLCTSPAILHWAHTFVLLNTHNPVSCLTQHPYPVSYALYLHMVFYFPCTLWVLLSNASLNTHIPSVLLSTHTYIWCVLLPLSHWHQGLWHPSISMLLSIMLKIVTAWNRDFQVVCQKFSYSNQPHFWVLVGLLNGKSCFECATFEWQILHAPVWMCKFLTTNLIIPVMRLLGLHFDSFTVVYGSCMPSSLYKPLLTPIYHVLTIDWNLYSDPRQWLIFASDGGWGVYTWVQQEAWLLSWGAEDQTGNSKSFLWGHTKLTSEETTTALTALTPLLFTWSTITEISWGWYLVSLAFSGHSQQHQKRADWS